MLPIALLVVACAPQPASYQRTDKYTAPSPGAILSVQFQHVEQADRLMQEVQSTLLAHPEWAGQTMDHGLDPPSGYSYKYRARCAALPPAALAVERLMKRAGAGPPRCQEVGY